MKKTEIEKRRPDDKKKLVAFEEEKHVYSSGRSTVEVTVKLRKRKSDLKSVVPSEQSLRTGSWADLLNQNQNQHQERNHNQKKKHSEIQLAKAEKHNTNVKKNDNSDVQMLNLEMQKENDSLKRQTATLLEDLSKKNAELKECFTAIKELRKLTDVLKYENECLLESRNQRVELEGSLKMTLTENHALKKQLSKVMKQLGQVSSPKDKQISKFRNAIKEMRSAIEDEVIRNNAPAVDGTTSSVSVFQQLRIAEDEQLLLSETNASEINRILNSTSSMSQLDEEGSSTQYMYVPKKSSTSSGTAPAEMNRVSPLISRPPAQTPDAVKTYSSRPPDLGNGMGDFLHSEYPLKDSQGLIQLSVRVASDTSSEYLSSSSSTLNEYRNRNK